jgi:light-regulated signal transduction histidine kinase (bacteriophytochrome)
VEEGIDGLERRVEERTAELRQAKEELEAFSYSVAHDLRAPSRRIQSFVPLLREDVGDRLSPDAASVLTLIGQQAGRMNLLIDDLLRLSMVSRAPLNRAPLDLSEEARAVASELRLREPAREVEWAIAPGLRTTADAGLTRILLENLLGNAWKFTSRAARPRIEVGGQGGEFFVRDNGAGFDMAQAGRLFQPFQRLHGAAEFSGSGIGLTIVRRIVSRHGGTIRAEGRVGQGATFRFTL